MATHTKSPTNISNVPASDNPFFELDGTVKWFDSAKGYGFITDNDNRDYYFGVKDVIGAVLPTNGDTVSFKPGENTKGLRASKVTIVAKGVHTSQHSNNSHRHERPDYRITCPSCYKKIVPRLVTYRGQADKSLCPYCGATVKRFGVPTTVWIAIIVVVAIFVLLF